jgi:carboxymethylenebutenolidase
MLTELTRRGISCCDKLSPSPEVCTMIERQIDIPTRDGSMTTFVSHPERNGPHPAVIIYMDAPGIREELRDMARRLASVGYYVLLPNLYYRAGVMELSPDAFVKDSVGRSRVSSLIQSLSIELIMTDSDALLSFLDGDPAAREGAIGLLGYCMSGQFAIHFAALHTDRVAAAASIYGTWLVTDSPDSPHLAIRRAAAEFYIACAEIDPWVPLDVVEALRRTVASQSVKAEVELFEGSEHGFAFPARHSYDRAAAERHWERVFALLDRNLHHD